VRCDNFHVCVQILAISALLLMLRNEDKNSAPPTYATHCTIKASNGGANSSNYNAAVSIAITAGFVYVAVTRGSQTTPTNL
jgi:hypothetical protein